MYTINASPSIYPNTYYNVSVTLHEARKPATFRIEIVGSGFGAHKEVNIQPSATEVARFKIPAIRRGRNYKINFKGVVDGISFEKTKSLVFRDSQKLLVFIQTDKAVYKPGDLVRFRVLFLDNNTCPAKLDHPVYLQITDKVGNILSLLKNINVKNGVYSDSYQLTEFANQGEWKISINNENNNLETKSFEVAKYVLPKFDVRIESPPVFCVDEKTLKVQIRSNYTYGKPVTGKVTVSVGSESSNYYTGEVEKYFEKSSNITGKAEIEFNLANDLSFLEKYKPSTLMISATVEEELTGLKQNQYQKVSIRYQKFTLEGFEVPNKFHSEKVTEFKVAVKKFDGTPVINSRDPVTLVFENNNKEYEYEKFTDATGIATWSLRFFGNKGATTFSLTAKYKNINNFIGRISEHVESGSFLELEVETKNPVVYEDVNISLKSSLPICSFVYHIVKYGSIIKTGCVKSKKPETVHMFTIKPSISMCPSVKILVFGYCSGKLHLSETKLTFKNDLENTIELEACDETTPGKEVELEVKTHPNSFVGLMGVDQSVLILQQGNNFETSTFFNKMEYLDKEFERSNRHNWEGIFYSVPPTIITVTSAVFEEREVRRNLRLRGGGLPMYVRKNFPETWIWEDIKTTDSTTTIKRVIPDTMTSWILTGFALNKDKGLAITKEPTKIRVFQPFFISMNLPYSVKRGEVISIPVTIFNYMENKVSARVVLENDDNEFEFAEDDFGKKAITVFPDVGKNILFKIRATKVGQITLKVKASSTVAGDIIHQMLRVEPEGVTEYVNKAILLNLTENIKQLEKIDIDIPEYAVKDSQIVELLLVGDILGPTIKNLDQLVRVPYGCGEQNMVNFVPNILVLRYLEASNQSNEAIQRKAKRFLAIGYERQLSYKHKDGSYSAFGDSSTDYGSTWLTAYVARSFHQAMPYTFIDDKIIEAALKFLVSKQIENGSFREDGTLFDHHHASGTVKGVALTAFVLLAFLENKESIQKYKYHITKGLDFLAGNIDIINDLYAESISTLVLSLAKHNKSKKALEMLNKKATQESDKKFWIIPKKKEINSRRWCPGRPSTHDVEVTSYAFLSFADHLTVEEMFPTIKWLISQRNSKGGFFSTQDTVVGLQALTKFAEKGGAGTAEMGVLFKDDKGTSGLFNVDKENSLVLQSHILSKDTKTVDVSAYGKGSCLLQISYRFNLDNKIQKPAFKIKPLVKECKSDALILRIVVNYLEQKSNMAVLEVSLPSGYIAEKDATIDNLTLGDKSTNGNKFAAQKIKKVETKNDETVVVIYFDSLTKEEVCIEVCALRTHEVDDLKKSPVLLYDYYDNTKVAKEFYEL